MVPSVHPGLGSIGTLILPVAYTNVKTIGTSGPVRQVHHNILVNAEVAVA